MQTFEQKSIKTTYRFLQYEEFKIKALLLKFQFLRFCWQNSEKLFRA